jgi:S1-C subfamily serine protease
MQNLLHWERYMKFSAVGACLLLVILGGISGATAEEALPTDVLQDLQSATVLIKVASGTEQSSGSGFLIEANKDTGYIVTAAHVCPPPGTGEDGKQQIKVVLNSGTKDEREAPAKIVAQSADADLSECYNERPE